MVIEFCCTAFTTQVAFKSNFPDNAAKCLIRIINDTLEFLLFLYYMTFGDLNSITNLNVTKNNSHIKLN